MFIDEYESVFAKRGSKQNDSFTDEIVQTFPSEWDGFDKQNHVMVIGATNRRDIMDKAVLSRFAEQIEIPLPADKDRQAIFTAELRKAGYDGAVPANAAADYMQGFSGRDISNLARKLLRSGDVTEESTKTLTEQNRTAGNSVSKDATWQQLVLGAEKKQELQTVCKKTQTVPAALRGGFLRRRPAGLPALRYNLRTFRTIKMNTMEKQWLELSLTAHSDDEALLIETALELSGALAVTYQAADEQEIFEPPVGTTPLWHLTKVTGLYDLGTDRAEVAAFLQNALGEDYPIAEHLLTDSDWVRAWLDHFQPIPFGDNFWVAATEHEIADKDAVVLRLDPGLAFGTGTHPSTAMCLNYLVNHAELAGKTVYDYGCGSGILGIAAALAGAKAVWQTDIDPQALTASLENAAKNGVSEKITVLENPDKAPKTDILIANILLEPLCFLRPQFEKHLRPDSKMYFAGLLERQEDTIRAHYQDGYDITRADERGGWILLALTPKTV